MPRLKLYYPLDEITTNLYTSGKQWMTTDNVEYIGLYHTYTTGEVYTQAAWDLKKSVQLIPYKDQTAEIKKNTVYKKLMSNLKLQSVTPTATSIQLKKSDIYRGNIQRYFIKKYNQSNLIEINAFQFEQWQNNIIDSKLYNSVKLTWYITGNINDIKTNDIVIEGVSTKNKKQIAIASQRIPELQLVLTNFIEYYSDNTFYTPKDINGLDS